MEFWTAVFTLVLVLDPVGNLTPVLAVMRSVEPSRRRLVIARESVFALGFLIVFYFGGSLILRLMGADTLDVRIAGGVVLFLIALRLIFPKRGEGLIDDEIDGGEPILVPLAVPLIAGPSALATVILMRSEAGLGPGSWPWGVLAILVAWSAATAVLLGAPWIASHLGERVLRALARLSGMLLIVISVHLLMTGLVSYFETIGG